jgi:signal transduction histidine kinase
MGGACDELTPVRTKDSDVTHAVSGSEASDGAWASLLVDDAARICAADVAHDEEAACLRIFRPGIRLFDALERLDAPLAAAVASAASERRSVSVSFVLRTRRASRAATCVFECARGGEASHLTIRVAGTAVGTELEQHVRRSDLLISSLAEILSLLNRESTQDVAARSVLPSFVRGLTADTGAVFRVRSDDRAELISAYGPTTRRGFPYAPVELSDVSIAPITQKPGVLVLDGTRVDGLPAAVKDVCVRRAGMVVAAPAFSGHSLTAIVMVAYRAARLLSEEEVDFLRVAADSLGLGLGRVTLARQSWLSEAVVDTACAVARAISGSLDLEQTFKQIAMSAARVMGNCQCLLLERSLGPGPLYAVACSDPADETLIGLGLEVPQGVGPDNALGLGRSIIVDDVIWGASAPAQLRERLSIRSLLFVPVRAEDELLGALMLYSPERRESYSKHDIARAEVVAEQAASAIRNARLFQDLTSSQEQTRSLLERITRVREEQRHHLAGVIHDDVVQAVVAALYEAESLRELLPAETQQEVDRVSGLLTKAINDARRVIWELRPPALKGLGLPAALRALTDRLDAETEAAVTLKLGELSDVPDEVGMAAFVIAREALQNAHKHSHAAHVHVSLTDTPVSSAQDRAVLLRVQDDGVGFDTKAARDGQHYGLDMIEERAAMVGGLVAIESEAGGGVTVDATLPCGHRKRHLVEEPR